VGATGKRERENVHQQNVKGEEHSIKFLILQFSHPINVVFQASVLKVYG
jgi:hypothetical protein